MRNKLEKVELLVLKKIRDVAELEASLIKKGALVSRSSELAQKASVLYHLS